jgi:hypothetical protein
LAAVTPETASSTTKPACAGTPSSLHAVRNISGCGLPCLTRIMLSRGPAFFDDGLDELDHHSLLALAVVVDDLLILGQPEVLERRRS